MKRYTEEQIDTKEEETTTEHTLRPELACIMAEQAGEREDWEQVRAWLEVADKHERNQQHVTRKPTLVRGTPAVGRLLPTAGSIAARGNAAGDTGGLSAESEAIRRVQRWQRALAERRIDHLRVASRPKGAPVVMNEPLPPLSPWDPVRLLLESLGIAVAIILACWALSAVSR